jgi:hypothetical protein
MFDPRSSTTRPGLVHVWMPAVVCTPLRVESPLKVLLRGVRLVPLMSWAGHKGSGVIVVRVGHYVGTHLVTRSSRLAYTACACTTSLHKNNEMFSTKRLHVVLV